MTKSVKELRRLPATVIALNFLQTLFCPRPLCSIIYRLQGLAAPYFQLIKKASWIPEHPDWKRQFSRETRVEFNVQYRSFILASYSRTDYIRGMNGLPSEKKQLVRCSSHQSPSLYTTPDPILVPATLCSYYTG